MKRTDARKPESGHAPQSSQPFFGAQAATAFFTPGQSVQRDPFFQHGVSASVPLQAKLTVGAVGDKYEQEADRVAATVVDQINRPAGPVGSDRSSVQRLGGEEEVQMRRSPDTLQRVEQEEALQMKPIADTIQRMGSAEEEELQMQPMPETIQREGMEEDELQMKAIAEPVQRQGDRDNAALLQGQFAMQVTPTQLQSTSATEENRTGMPDRLKSGLEHLSGFDMSGVRVHYNSAKPSRLQAHAYAQGTDIHVGPGQEKHLPHEAWHVVQQKQGRVSTSFQFKGTPINDNPSLEQEATVMGQKAVGANLPKAVLPSGLIEAKANGPAQMGKTEWISYIMQALPTIGLAEAMIFYDYLSNYYRLPIILGSLALPWVVSWIQRTFAETKSDLTGSQRVNRTDEQEDFDPNIPPPYKSELEKRSKHDHKKELYGSEEEPSEMDDEKDDAASGSQVINLKREYLELTGEEFRADWNAAVKSKNKNILEHNQEKSKLKTKEQLVEWINRADGLLSTRASKLQKKKQSSKKKQEKQKYSFSLSVPAPIRDPDPTYSVKGFDLQRGPYAGAIKLTVYTGQNYPGKKGGAEPLIIIPMNDYDNKTGVEIHIHLQPPAFQIGDYTDSSWINIYSKDGVIYQGAGDAINGDLLKLLNGIPNWNNKKNWINECAQNNAAYNQRQRRRDEEQEFG